MPRSLYTSNMNDINIVTGPATCGTKPHTGLYLTRPNYPVHVCFTSFAIHMDQFSKGKYF